MPHPKSRFLRLWVGILTMKKAAPKQVRSKAARKGRPAYLESNFKVGDRVKVLDVPEDLKDPDCDLKDPGYPKLRTGELFRFCLGRVFTVFGFGRYGHVELQVDRSPAVRKKGFSGTIWIEPEFLKRVGKQPLKARSSCKESARLKAVP